MTISDSQKLVSVFNDLVERNQILIACTSRKENGGVQMMMGGNGPTMMSMLAQAVASLYDRYADNMRAGTTFDEFLDDFMQGVRIGYREMTDDGGSIVTDMGGLIDMNKAKGKEE